jgi:hypothetical protein
MIALEKPTHMLRQRPDIARLIAKSGVTGETVLTYLSIADAAEIEGIDAHRIERAIETGLKCGGYIWKWEGPAQPQPQPQPEAELLLEPKQKIRGCWRAVSIDTGEIRSFQNLEELRAAGFVQNCVNTAIRLRKRYKNMIWFRGLDL